jgi:hypothetical protein
LTEVDHNGRKFAVKIERDDVRPGLNFFTAEEEFLQLGAWRYDHGKELAAHNHNRVPRQSDRTQECIIVLKGRLRAAIFSENDELLQEISVGAGEALLLLAGGHGYTIEEKDTIVLELKNGPYPGADLDRRRLNES